MIDTETGLELISTNDMQVGDTVMPHGRPSAWCAAIVKQITGDRVKLFRPYGTHTDFRTLHQVICYIGLEEYEVLKDDRRLWLLHYRPKHWKGEDY